MSAIRIYDPRQLETAKQGLTGQLVGRSVTRKVFEFGDTRRTRFSVMRWTGLARPRRTIFTRENRRSATFCSDARASLSKAS